MFSPFVIAVTNTSGAVLEERVVSDSHELQDALKELMLEYPDALVDYKPAQEEHHKEEFLSVPPPRAEDVFRDGRVIADRMLDILRIAGNPQRRGCLWTNIYTWAKRSWLQWLVDEGYLTCEGTYGYYPSDGPYHKLTEKGRWWIIGEGHKG